MALVSAKQILDNARDGHYAVPAININNLEWTKAVLSTAQEMNSPMLVAVSEGAVKYMGGFKTVVALVSALMDDLKVSVPVALHLDHGSFEGAKAALAAGFTSVMYDGSHHPIEQNLAETREIVAIAHAQGASVEAEVGSIGGEEDGIIGNGELADPAECKTMADTGIDFLAAGIGNIHGKYPANWTGLSFETLEAIKAATGNIPLVLHGGSGIPVEQTQKAINLGVSKINVNTELQLANAAALREFVISGKDLEGKNYDPRKLLAPGYQAMKDTVKGKIEDFGSANKA